MMASIHQPQYVPWIGYIDKIDRSDVFILLDNVQYKKNEWQNRNRIKTAQGWQWLTVPVLYRFPERINEVRINNKVEWRRKHMMAIEMNYRKAPYFREYFPYFEDIYRKNWEGLVDINISLIKMIVDFFGIKKKILIASEIETRDEPDGRLIDICKSVGADTYLSGKDGSKYMDMEVFDKAGIKVVIQDFEHPVYPQLYEGFEPNLSCIDLLFNCGDKGIEMVRKGRISS
jgi:hypothetical protein